MSEDGQPCASVPGSTDSRHVHPIRSAAFRDWLTNGFFSEFEMVPSPDAFRAVLRILEARARYGDFPSQKLSHRLGFEGDPFLPSRIILDLANSAGELLEIDSHGWRVRDNLHHSFRQSITTLPLPVPTAPKDPNAAVLNQFAELFSLSVPDRARIFAWLTTALRPIGPYPILVLHGPPGSGKTLLTRVLRALIDPAPALVRRLPAHDTDLLPIAFDNWILAFDDAYHFSSKICDTLSAISSGDALRIPQPDSRDALEFQIARPIILVAPHDETKPACMPPRALSRRTITLERQQIKRLFPEALLWTEFESLRPSLLAALSQAMVTALQRVRDVDLPAVSRFPDAAVWAAAAAPAFGLAGDAMAQALTDPAAVWTGSDPLRDALRTMLAPNTIWTGDATSLLNDLRAVAPRANLPNTPKGLSQALPGVPGFRVERKRIAEGERTLTISRVSEEELEATAGHMNRI